MLYTFNFFQYTVTFPSFHHVLESKIIKQDKIGNYLIVNVNAQLMLYTFALHFYYNKKDLNVTLLLYKFNKISYVLNDDFYYDTKWKDISSQNVTNF